MAAFPAPTARVVLSAWSATVMEWRVMYRPWLARQLLEASEFTQTAAEPINRLQWWDAVS